ncbi:hypothetical protein [Chromobacterium sphagni]|uniref:Uncharacterized protein n=1 Tax=Chromobacterium sphagni TaxID=1903179 RepID=A0A1S1X3L9_9NEIS|nr:hypothetical protein [Chromobacterium sphagni]OHX14028.1 hypothetical protein BI347_11295 [Chromobacterium sphagni]OHX20237.1 hypothetical protein BI344_06995 [Chromobacterium sphagni]
MDLPDWFYGVASILAGVVLLFLTWKKHRRGVREDGYSRVGKIVIALFMIAFGVLLFKVSKA